MHTRTDLLTEYALEVKAYFALTLKTLELLFFYVRNCLT